MRLVLILLSLPTFAFGWGRQGHMTIALIADQLLTPQGRAYVEQLRGVQGWQDLKPGAHRGFEKADNELIQFCSGPDADLSLISDWADAWKSHYGRFNTGPFHYINLPITGQGSPQEQTDACGSEGACLPFRLTYYANHLVEKSPPDLAKLEALLWVVHLAGDDSQPLHCADDHDRGGNRVEVRVLGRKTNLHAAYDTGFFYATHSRPDELSQDLLLHECKSVPRQPWAPDLVPVWTQESFGIAKTFVYPQERALGGHYGQVDVAKAWTVVRLQLARAGVRLAGIINAAAAAQANE